MTRPAVSIIIVSFNTERVLRECLAAVTRHCDARRTEVIVVDNASSDGSCEMVRQAFPQVLLIASPSNLGFGAANNIGVEAARAPIVLLLNTDAIVSCDAAEALAAHLAAHEDIACIAPRIVLPDGRPQAKTFGHLPSLWRIAMQSFGLSRLFPGSALLAGIDGEARRGREMTVGWVSGVCMAMRRRPFRAIGGFDARFFMYCEDVDLCRRLARYGRIVTLDEHPVMHYGGASSKTLSHRVRNAVWQQRNLLTIVRDTSGAAHERLARIVMLPGLLVRLLVGASLVPRAGIRGNFILAAAWARLVCVVRGGRGEVTR